MIICAPAPKQARARLTTHPASRVPSAASSAIGDRRRAAGAELNPEFRFRLEAGLGDPFDEARQVIIRYCDEPGRQFDDIEAEGLCFGQILSDGIGAIA
jgi:hypothetical protein